MQRILATLIAVVFGVTMSNAEHFRTAEELVSKIERSGIITEIHAVLDIEAERIPPTDEGLTGLEVKVDAKLEPFGRDGAGGFFFVLSDERILLVDSEGQVGVVAASFEEFVGITTGLASWRDALRFVNASDVTAGRDAWRAFDAKWRLSAKLSQPWPYYPEGFSTRTPAEGRAAINAYFGTPPLEDPFGALYRAVRTLNAGVRVEWQGNALHIFGATAP